MMQDSRNIKAYYTTFPDASSAEQCARVLVDLGLVACANILCSGTSIYKWEGKVESSGEVYILFKTLKSKENQLEKKLVELHPYDCPCFLELDVGHVFSGYAKWLTEQVE